MGGLQTRKLTEQEINRILDDNLGGYMKPKRFKEQNKVYAENQEPYLPLPVYEDSKQGS